MQTTNIYIVRQFDCSAKDLFSWFTDPLQLRRWFGPKHLQVGQVENDFKIGGFYSIELIKSNGDKFYIEGEYLDIEQSKRLGFSFKYSGLRQSPPDSLVSISIEAINSDKSGLKLVQQFTTVPKEIENKTKNWELMFSRLNAFLRA